MSRRWPAPSLIFLFGLVIASGCASETKPDAAPAPNGVNYGENKMPPPEAVQAKSGRAAGSPGAPPARR